MIDSLQEFLVAGFRAREMAGIRSPRLDAEGVQFGRSASGMGARDYAAQFAADLKACGVTEHEHACLWARYQCEGRPGASWSADRDGIKRQRQCFAPDYADFVERFWGAGQSAEPMPRFTGGAVRAMLKSADAKIKRRRPWMRRQWRPQ